MDNDISVITAFYDIGRGNLPKVKHGRELPFYQHRSVDTYFDFFEKLAKLQNEMVIYTTPDFEDRISTIRKNHGLEELTKVVTTESYLPEGFELTKAMVQKVMDDPSYYGKVVNPQLIEYWHADYVLVNIFKSWYAVDAIKRGLIHNDLTAWIDFGYVRNDMVIPPKNKWSYNFDREKIHFFNQHPIDKYRSIDSIIYTGDVYIQGCHIVAGTEKWKLLKQLVLKNVELLLENNLIDDDQTLLLMSYLSSPQDFELHDANPNDWFRIFRVYNEHAYDDA
jgi:protein YibB